MEQDAALLRRWSEGDDTAAQQLVERYFDGLFRFFRNKTNDDVDDLIHDVLLACLERRDQLHRWRSFRAYVFAMARHRLYARIRTQVKEAQMFDPAVTSIAMVEPGPSSVAAAAQLHVRLLAALKSIPLDLQIALELRFWEELSGPELAEALDIPEGTVRSRLRRGLDALRLKLEGPGAPTDGGPPDFEAWAARLGAASPPLDPASD